MTSLSDRTLSARESALARQVAVMRLLAECASAANRARSLPEALDACIGAVCRLERWSAGYFLVREAVSDELVPTRARYLADPAGLATFDRFMDGHRIPRGTCLAGWVFSDGAALQFQDLALEPDCPLGSTAAAAGLTGLHVCPLVVGGHLEGVLTFFCGDGRPAAADVVAAIAAVCEQLACVRERELATAALAADAEHHRVMNELHPDLVAVTVDGRIAYINPAGARILGADAPGQIEGLRTVDVVVEDEHPALIAREEQTVITGKPNPPARRTLRRLDGQLAQIEGRSLRTTFEGRPGVLVIGRDITERLRAERLLDESEMRYRRLVDLLPDMVVVHQDGKIVYVNAAGAAMLGYPSACALEGTPVLGIVAPEYHERVLARVKRIQELPHPTPPDVQELRRMDGSPVLVEVVGVATTHEGRPANLTVGRDVTAQVLAQRALGESEERFRSVVEWAHEAIVLADEAARILFCNPRALEMFGWRADELIGESLDVLIPPAWRQAHRHAPVRSGEGPGAFPGRTLELTARRRDGTEFPIELATSTWRGKDGLVFGSLIRDISSRRDLERLKEEFLSTVSHELRTPLNTLCAAIELLRGPLKAEQHARMVAIADNNARRLGRLVTDLLDAQAVGRGTLRLVKRPTDVAAVVRQAAEVMHPHLQAAGLDLVVTHAEAALIVDGDRMIQVLTNLLSNAIKFSPRGSRIELALALADEGAVVTVGDRGRGIPADRLEAVFERFVQVYPEDAKLGGTGLGLAICRAIVEGHGGRIRAERREGGGTTIVFTLPYDDPAEEAVRG